MAMAAAAAASSSSARATAILLVALFFAAGVHAQPYPCALPACKTVGGGSEFFDVQFCLDVLGSDGRSAGHCMDYQTYSVIAADSLAARENSTAAKVAGLLRDGGGDAATARCLRSCQALYAGAVRSQPGCAAAVRAGAARKDEAARCLEAAAAAADRCEDGFRKSKAASPVTEENKDAFMLAKLAVAFLGYVF